MTLLKVQLFYLVMLHSHKYFETTGNLKKTVDIEIVHGHQIDTYMSRQRLTCLIGTYLKHADFLESVTLPLKQQAASQRIPCGLLRTA